MQVPTTPHRIPAAAAGELRRKSSGSSSVARVVYQGTVDAVSFGPRFARFDQAVGKKTMAQQTS
jgi:hypothetical protein